MSGTYDAISEQWIDETNVKRGPSDELEGSKRWLRDLDAQRAVEGTCNFFEARSELSTIMQTTGLPDIRGE